MAENTPDKIQRFDGNLNTDTNDYALKDNEYVHARNAFTEFTSNRIGNEPANKFCIKAKYPIIGTIYLYEDRWMICSTNDVNCEVGIYKESTCEYSPLPGNFDCLNWNRKNLITGVARQNFDCTWSTYFSDGHRNNDRSLNVDRVPYLGSNVTDPNGCEVFVPSSPLTLDCSKIRLNRPTKMPCIRINKGASGGSVYNGSYYATIAYSINGQKVTNYSNLSNIVSLFDHNNAAGALEITLTNLDESYDEFELVVISIVNQQTVARRVGLYSTQQQKISLDIISNELPSVPLQYLPVHNPLLESSDSITELNDHLIRIAPRSKFDFNYQPLANNIKVKWVSVEYPADYYRNGGPNTNFLRDENAALFIRWVYDDSDLSASFHLPGRAPSGTVGVNADQDVIVGIYPNTYRFENINSASQTSTNIVPIGDGGYQIAEGDMGYFETDERYPVNKPAVWGNLCGKKIRHHKFPEIGLTNRTNLYSDTSISPIGAPVIRVMGIKVLNIAPPVDNNGALIPGIIGYQILRGSREGNRTIIAEGIINDMFAYELLDGSGKTGLYQNYPYNSVQDDPFISTSETSTNFAGIVRHGNPNPGATSPGSRVDDATRTFHSPDTNFRRPFLSAKELKIYGTLVGQVGLNFVEPNKHPKHKLMTNASFLAAAIMGIGYSVLKLNGRRSTKFVTPQRVGSAQEFIRDNRTQNGTTQTTLSPWTGTILGAPASFNPIPPLQMGGVSIFDNSVGAGIADTTATTAFIGAAGTEITAQAAYMASTIGIYDAGADILQAVIGGVNNVRNTAVTTALSTALIANPLMEGAYTETSQEGGQKGATGPFSGILSAFGTASFFLNYWGEGTDESLELIRNFSQWQQYALQQYSHCFYNSFSASRPATNRYLINNANYLGSTIQDFGTSKKINNLYRSSCVVLDTSSIAPILASGPNFINPQGLDNTKKTLGGLLGNTYSDPVKSSPFTVDAFGRPIQAASYYTALKVRLRNQYGQIGDVKQIPIGCTNNVTITSTSNIFQSPVIFGGDTYVTRYTEKNTMFFFYDWLYEQPDGFEYDYLSRKMLQYPMYWADTKKWDVGDFLQGMLSGITGMISVSGSPPSVNTNLPSFNGLLPTSRHALDKQGAITGAFVIKKAYHYLFVSGVRDFYVESEVNVGYRDWKDPVIKRHFDHQTYTDLRGMFDAKPDIIKADNYYEYDYSLSVSKAFTEFASWGHVQPVYYDPDIAETCFVKHPKRVIWSLPQQFEQVRDNWKTFLANNYRDFRTDILTLQSIGLTGALMLFKSGSPLQIQGVETLQTGAGTKLTIGDGSFLSQASQNLTNADRPYEHGSCQNIRSVINTPSGLFWVSQNQGKIFIASQGLMDIAMEEMQAWFARYLPYEILKDFPSFELIDNAVTGVACQAVYDNENLIAYFTKKDYKKRTDILDRISYVSGDDFLVNGVLPIKLGDPDYFEDASWTVSYDVKRKRFISPHDWHPDLLMPSKNTFSSIKTDGIWIHNVRTDLFCNYYGIDYPFEIEYLSNTVLSINTLRSVEYQLEVYKYDVNQYDKFLYLEENFDEAVVYNQEQVSGLLRLINTPFNNPWLINQYPIYNIASTDILFSKIESKYRFNQFADITDDRGEFTTATRMIWNTGANGYVKTLNPVNLNYNKSPFERKKFRGYAVNVFLRRKVSGDKKFLLNFSVNKNLPSQR